MSILTTIVLDIDGKNIIHNSITGFPTIVSGENNITNLSFNFINGWTNYSKFLIVKTPKEYVLSPYNLSTNNFTIPENALDGYGLLQLCVTGSNISTNSTLVTTIYKIRVEESLPTNG